MPVVPIQQTGTVRGHFFGTVTANAPLCREHYRLTVEVRDFPHSHPGQFAQILCMPGSQADALPADAKFLDLPVPPLTELFWQPAQPPPHFHDRFFTGAAAYLRRPFSIADRRDRGPTATAEHVCELDFIYRVIGKGTRGLESMRPGHRLSLLGPLGRGFTVSDKMDLAILVGGGVGIPPMIYLAKVLHEKKIAAMVLAGAQRRDLLPLKISPGDAPSAPLSVGKLLVDEFARYGFPTMISTDDGSLGFKGYVTGMLESFLAGLTAGQRGRAVIFCCGPTPMMRVTAAIATKFAVQCQVSLEQPMACGMGTCQSCIIKYQPPGQKQWVYKLTCTDGPVFRAEDILW